MTNVEVLGNKMSKIALQSEFLINQFQAINLLK